MWRCPWLLICVTVCLLLDYPTYSRQQDGASGTAIYKEDYREYYVILGLQALYMGRAGPGRQICGNSFEYNRCVHSYRVIPNQFNQNFHVTPSELDKIRFI